MQELQNNGAHPAGFAEYHFFKEDKMDNGIAIMEMEGMNLIDARALHDVLQVGKYFANWMKDRIEKYGFVEGEDFLNMMNFACRIWQANKMRGFCQLWQKPLQRQTNHPKS